MPVTLPPVDKALEPVTAYKLSDPLRFGRRLKKYREDRNVSQSKLAERAGFDHSYISRLESGARMPTDVAVTRLATALKLTQDEHDALLDDAGFRTETLTIRLNLTKLATLDRLYGQVDDELRNQISAVVDLIISTAELRIEVEGPRE
jgi:transcriptional regulator with XRE-family HTH domain